MPSLPTSSDVAVLEAVAETSQDRALALLREFRPQAAPPERRIFVNRNLRMSGLSLIGFDMDYTLAEYTVAMETLQIQMTLERLVKEKGYPRAALDLQYDPAFAIRGLVIDKRLGNILKADGHRHISRGLHGLRELTKDERKSVYRQERIRMKGDRYALVDTIFGVPETWLFAVLVDLDDQKARKRPRADRYVKIYDDIRTTIDRIHADDSLKSLIIADIATYIRRDPELPATLVRLRAANKRLFLMTNSLAPYTQAVMSHLLDGARPDHPDWRSYFDVICVGSRKPAFFEHSEPFRRLDDKFQPTTARVRSFEQGVLYHGGNRTDFEKILGQGGDQILYVGDNMYGDILRSKTLSAWRTALIVPELEAELGIVERMGPVLDRREDRDTLRRQLDAEIHHQEHLLAGLRGFARRGDSEGTDREALDRAITMARKSLKVLERSLQACLAEIYELNTQVSAAFNPHFGMMFKCGDEHSIFGEQVEDYACLYTSRVTNFLLYSPFQYFRAPRDLLPHEVPPIPARLATGPRPG